MAEDGTVKDPEPTPKPEPPFEQQRDRALLKETVERVVDVLIYLSRRPELLVAGRHHEAIRATLEELLGTAATNEDKERIEGAARPLCGKWNSEIDGATWEGLRLAGLTGKPLAMKSGLVAKSYAEFLDLAAERPSKDTELLLRELARSRKEAEMAELREQIPYTWLGKWSKRLGLKSAETLQAGNVVLGSLGKLPVIEQLLEFSEFSVAALSSYDNKSG